jgi:hypothetical protein
VFSSSSDYCLLTRNSQYKDCVKKTARRSQRNAAAAAAAANAASEQ